MIELLAQVDTGTVADVIEKDASRLGFLALTAVVAWIWSSLRGVENLQKFNQDKFSKMQDRFEDRLEGLIKANQRLRYGINEASAQEVGEYVSGGIVKGSEQLKNRP